MTSALTLRPARGDDDYQHFLPLFPLLETGDPAPSPARFRDEIAPNSTVAERDGRVAGFVYAQVLADSGYVRVIIVAPDAQRSGVGRALMQHQRARFVAAGVPAWRLNVKVANARARALYESLGMRAAYASFGTRLSWEAVSALPSAPADSVTVREPGPDEDREIESTLLVVPGMLATARAQGKVLRVARGAADGALLGACLFDPGFPGCFAFRARSPAVARALLDAVRPYAPPDGPHVHVVVERDEALAEAIAAAGGEIRMRMLHYEGALS